MFPMLRICIASTKHSEFLKYISDYIVDFVLVSCLYLFLL